MDANILETMPRKTEKKTIVCTRLDGSSVSAVRPTTVVSSANVMMEVVVSMGAAMCGGCGEHWAVFRNRLEEELWTM